MEAIIDQAFLGTLLHAPVLGAVEVLSDQLIVVDPAGTITAVYPAASAEGLAALQRLRAAGRVFEMSAEQWLIPGLIDLHVHAPQWPQMGKALDLPLEDWLQQHTFPLEARYADEAFAEEIYRSLVTTLLANGTTTAAYFATLHLPASRILAEICLSLGQRALVGRVAMDDPDQCPAWYRDENAETAVAQTRSFIETVRALPGNAAELVKPVITPRFIPTCTDALLQGLGALAAETGCHVQTHCSESDWEHQFVLDRCGVSDAAALDARGLLGRRTILAHGNFLGPGDLDLLARTGAGIAHCPLSNAYFSDAVLPVREALARKVNVGLGTDIAGGPSPSMLTSARMAATVSRILERGADPNLPREARGRDGARLTAAEAFWLATTGGGRVLDLPLGLFRAGYAFDAVLVQAGRPHGGLQAFADDTLEDLLSKLIYVGGRADIARVWVAGRMVHSS